MNYPDFFYNIARFVIQPKDILAFCQVNKLFYSIMKKKFLLLAQIRAERFKNPHESAIKTRIIWRRISMHHFQLYMYQKRFNLTTLKLTEFNKNFSHENRWTDRNTTIQFKLKRHPLVYMVDLKQRDKTKTKK